jgi:hypothetical protein
VTVRRLGAVVLLLVAGASPVLLARGFLQVEPVAGGMVVRSTGPDRQRCFELTFSERAGGISAWYDLDRDPGRTHNLAGHGDLPSVALLTHALTLVGSRWKEVLYSAPAQTLTVPEDDVVRVQVRLEGSYSPLSVAQEHRGEGEGARPPAGVPSRSSPIRFVTTYTVYPVGQLYVRHSLVSPATTVKVAASEWLLGTAPSSDFRALGSSTGGAGSAASDFLLQTSNGPVYFGDVLLIPQRRRVPVTRWSERFSLGAEGQGATRSAFEANPPGTVLGMEPSVWCFSVQVEPDWVDRPELVSAVAEAYHRPPTLSVEPGWGELVRSDPGDLNLDGFSEGEGCYTLRAAAAGCRLTLDLSDSLLTVPVFRFAGWHGSAPRTVSVNGKPWNRDRDFQAILLDGSTLLLQLYEGLPGGKVTLEVRTGLAAPPTSASGP